MVTLRGVNAALSAFVFAAPDSPLTLVGVGAGVVIPEPDAEAGAKGDTNTNTKGDTTAPTITIAFATPRLTIVVRRNAATTSGDGDAICPHAIQCLRGSPYLLEPREMRLFTNTRFPGIDYWACWRPAGVCVPARRV